MRNLTLNEVSGVSGALAPVGELAVLAGPALGVVGAVVRHDSKQTIGATTVVEAIVFGVNAYHAAGSTASSIAGHSAVGAMVGAAGGAVAYVLGTALTSVFR